MSQAASTTRSATRPASSRRLCITTSTASSGSGFTAFAGEDATLEDLERLFLSVVEAPLADGYGCLVNNSIIEFGNAEGIASEGIAATLTMVREAVDSVLKRQLGREASDAGTMHLLLLYHGILTLSRSSTSFDGVAAVIRAEFGGLKELRDRPGTALPQTGSLQPGVSAMLTMINPVGYPNPPFMSQGTEAKAPQRMLFVSGQVGVDAKGHVGRDIGEQAKIATANVNGVLAAAGMDNSNLAKVTIYLTDESLIPGFMEAAADAVPLPPPATTLLIVNALAAPSLLVEIEAIAIA